MGATVTVVLSGQRGSGVDVQPVAFSLSGTYSGKEQVLTPTQLVEGINAPIQMFVYWTFNSDLARFDTFVNGVKVATSGAGTGSYTIDLDPGDSFYFDIRRNANRTGQVSLYNISDLSALLAQFNVTITP